MLLADIQSGMRSAIIAGDVSGVASLLAGGKDARKRLAVHQRHYAASLTTAILTKFPATIWLTGSEFVTAAARRYVAEHPPQAPCIAEYGASFPEHLEQCPGADRVPYLRDFAELEWRVGQVSIAVDAAPLSLQGISEISSEALADMTLRLQPGLHYLRVSWPVDELMKLYLTDSAPAHLTFDPEEAWIEIRGARGEFQFVRLDRAEFVFRKGLHDGQSLGEAAEHGIQERESFDLGQALVALVAAGLVVAVRKQ